MSKVKVNSSNDKCICLCEICKCGDHKCIPKEGQIHSKIDELGLVKDVNESKMCCVHKKCRSHASNQLMVINLYSKSTYKEDFTVKPNIAGPPETSKLAGTLKCEDGTMQTTSAYKRDYVSYPVEEVKLFNLNQKEDGGLVEDVKEKFDVSELEPEVFQRLRNYYCPSHCLGKAIESKINCLSIYKDKFNLGPPSKKTLPPMKKSTEPFSKFTNYLLDYIPHKITPRQKPSHQQPQIHILKDSEPPRPTDTTHKTDYICWSPENYAKKTGLRPTEDDSRQTTKTTPLDTGVGGSMDLHSSSAMDYRDPNVAGRKETRRSPQKFRVPDCKMETKTTSGLAFQKWNVPVQKKVKPSEETNCFTSSNDTSCFVTNYQQDFDNLKKAFCPAKIIEKYGRKILEPKYHYIGSENEHEYYRCEK